MRGKYFTEKERYQLEILLKEGYKAKDIAQKLGKCTATIYNEINRGMTEQLDSRTYEIKKIYLADAAQNRYLRVREHKGVNLKIGRDFEFVHYLEKEIGKNKRSPQAVLGYIKSHNLNFKTEICFKTLYNYLDRNLFLNISNKDLPIKRCAGKRHYHKIKVSLKNPCARSIDGRPEYILNRSGFGHWEMDTVVSGTGKGKACLLVLSERFSRKELIYKISSKHSKSVVSVLDKIEGKIGTRRFRNIFKTITVDNGCEFSDTVGMERHNRSVIYYCHPYSSWERGTNENINKMIRRFIPKGANIDDYSAEDIKRVEYWINNYPRKIHGFFSANEICNNLKVQ